MPYVSCMYAPPSQHAPEAKPAGQKAVVCTDENGVLWFLTEDSQVGDWIRYEGEVLAYDEATYETWQNPPEAKPAKAKRKR